VFWLGLGGVPGLSCGDAETGDKSMSPSPRGKTHNVDFDNIDEIDEIAVTSNTP
jgi:hypothetical protein